VHRGEGTIPRKLAVLFIEYSKLRKAMPIPYPNSAVVDMGLGLGIKIRFDLGIARKASGGAFVAGDHLNSARPI
jgi:hypothetical protein